MIIQSLVALYDRLEENPDVILPKQGYAEQKVSFALVLNLDGDLVQVKDLREFQNNKLRPKAMLLPSIERSGQGFSPQFMWDNTQYVLGAVSWDENKPAESEKKRIRALSAFEEFKKSLQDFLQRDAVPELLAVNKFLSNWQPEAASGLEEWNEVADSNIVFIIDGERQYLHNLDVVKKEWVNRCAAIEDPAFGTCLLQGKQLPLARLHPMLKNVDGAQAKGAAIVSFNKSAFCSYGKEQSYNAPLNVVDTFKYTASLNYLLRRMNNSQRLKIGDTTTVFWTEKASAIESFLGFVLDPHNDAGENLEVQKFLESARKGTMPTKPNFEGAVNFYILGLAPNNSRLAVRFWHVCTVEQLMERIGKHFNDLEMERQYPNDLRYPGVWHLLKETARETKDISPLLGGALMRSILEGSNYPQNLYAGVLNRIRADQEINYLKASILKAVLKRNYKKEVPMSLDLDRREPAYLLGRLFAVLEKAQLDALGKVNATIKDRFFSAASATPGSVFPRLIRLSQYHIEKAEYGYVSEKRIAEIMENINCFPAHLNMQDQGLFAIAYYQQKNDLYKKKETPLEGEKNV